MNLIKLVASASVSFSVTLATPTFAVKTATPIECSNVECFLRAAKTCTQAKLDPKQLGFQRSERMEIRGEQNNKCLYYAMRSPLPPKGFACQFYTNDGLVAWLEMMSRRRRVIYDSRKVVSDSATEIGQRTIETINGEDVAECLWR